MFQTNRLLFLLAGALAFASATAAKAADRPRFEATPFAGYRTGGEFEIPGDDEDSGRSVDVDDEASFGIDLGLYRDNRSFYELLYSRQESSLDSDEPALDGVDVRTEYYHFGGTLLLDHETWYEPYLSLTIGATRFVPQGGDFDSETKFSASLGGGFRLPINDHLAATLGARGYLTFVGSDTAFFCSSVNGAGSCLVKSSGSTYFQAEAQLGLTLKF